MFSIESLVKSKNSVAKVTTVLLVSHLIRTQILNEERFNNKWAIASGATLVGVLAHELITSRLNKLVSLCDKKAKALKDIIKYATILTTKQVIITGLRGEVTLSKDWITKTALMLAGYTLFNMYIEDKIPKLVKYQDTLLDSAKMASALLISDYFTDYDIESDTIQKMLASIGGIFVFHTIVKPQLL